MTATLAPLVYRLDEALPGGRVMSMGLFMTCLPAGHHGSELGVDAGDADMHGVDVVG